MSRNTHPKIGIHKKLACPECHSTTWQKYHSLNIAALLENIYGPTEAAVYATHYSLKQWQGRYRIPIGIPMKNTAIYIMGKYGHFQPIGVPGELYISGNGLARGYINKPELTGDVFCHWRQVGFLSRHKFYKSGDLARWQPDGNIEFLGRLDHQVKVRGFRVELEEIENHLQKIPGIKQSVAVTRGNTLKPGDGFICAYVTADYTIDPAEVKKHLAQKLPAYMIPGYVVQLEQFPLTPSGKQDRTRLPDPRQLAGLNAAPEEIPGSEIEKQLLETWAQVLGRMNISINDNFFAIGGDSIKAIQVAARMNKAGYKLEMRDIFLYSTISLLASQIKRSDRIPNQSIIMGNLPLTPIQAALFQESNVHPHYYNQAVMLYAKQSFEPEVARAILMKIQEHHDALRITFKYQSGNKNRGKSIQQFNHGLEHPLDFEVLDLRQETNALEKLCDKTNQTQANINLETGPLMKTVLFQMQDGNRLLVVIHHLVIDGVSWRFLFEDLETLYHQYQQGIPFELPLKSDPYKLWAEKLSSYGNSPGFLKEKSYWAKLEPREIPDIPLDFPGKDNFIKDIATLSAALDKNQTTLLLTGVNHAFGTEINDILLTGLAMGFYKTFGLPEVLIALEGHGREGIFTDIDINRTVGWFTTVYPVILEITHENDLARQIISSKETLHRIPGKGIGYGILKYLTAPELKTGITFKLRPQVIFNYLGQFDTDIRNKTFPIAAESSGNTRDPQMQREYELEISALVSGGQFIQSITYNKKHFKSQAIQTPLDHSITQLQRIISFCSARQERTLTPCDLQYKGMTTAELETLNHRYQNRIQDIYPLSPTQEGMLFHVEANPGSSLYFNQVSHRIRGEFHIPIVEQTVNELLQRHDALRTVFIYMGYERPLQLVLEKRQMEFNYHDLRTQPTEKEKQIISEDIKQQDRQRSFVLDKDVMMRFTVFQTEDDCYEFVWSYHHIILDGWCVGLLLREFFEIYSAHLRNQPHRLSPTKPFKNYIAWLEQQDLKKGLAYWQAYLQDYNHPAALPAMQRQSSSTSYSLENYYFTLDTTLTHALRDMARGHKVTLNTVFLALWGILLVKYNNTNDIVFGSVVSGRPATLEGIEHTIGMFINTIPIRITVTGNQTFVQLLNTLHQQSIRSQPYEYVPLVEIQENSLLKQRLFDHIINFYNLPVQKKLEPAEIPGKPGLHLEKKEEYAPTNYDFNVNVSPGEYLSIKFKYNSRMFETGTVKELANHLITTAETVVKNPEIKIAEIQLLSLIEKKSMASQLTQDLEVE